MSNIDLTGISDDQLVELARACCEEAIRRGAVTQDAVHDLMLSEAERARIARNVVGIEVAAARAREREMIAAEAAEMAKIVAAKVESDRAKERAAALVAAREALGREVLQKAADGVGMRPGEISVLNISGKYGHRVLINQGKDRYASSHLVDYHVSTAKIKTSQPLVKSKRGLIPICAAISAEIPVGTFLSGSSFTWE